MGIDSLHSEPKDGSGFTVPENYFINSRKRLLSKVNDNGFSVPGQYIEDSRTNILYKVSGEKKQRAFKLNAYWYSAAAALLILSGMYFLFPQTNHVADFNSVSNDEIINYVGSYENISNIPVYDLAEHISAPVSQTEEEMLNQIDEELLLNEL